MSSLARWRGQAAPVWDAVPPPPRVKKYEKLKVCSTQPVELLILSAQLEETWTHYADQRTVFCTGPEKGCWLDHALVGKPRYGAWLAVQAVKVRVPYLLRLTSVAVSVEPRLRQLRGGLRGRRLQVWRIHAYEGAEMHCKLLDSSSGDEILLPAPDVRYCVERMVAAEDRPANPSKGKWKPFSTAASAAAGKPLQTQ